MNKNAEIGILIIEDYHPLLKSLHELLSMHYKVAVAMNTMQARELIKNSKPDLIISDVMLPNEDGFQFIKLLKNDPLYALIPVIFLTALNDEDNIISGFESGAVDYMTKPFKNKELLVRINAILKYNKDLTNHLELKHFVKQKNNAIPISEDSKIENIILEFINENYSDPDLSLPQIAAHLRVSVSSLMRRFNRTYGETASTYIKKYRLKRAEIMIKQGMGNLSEISSQCGFTTQQYFSKCYKEHFGQSPSNFKIKKA